MTTLSPSTRPDFDEVEVSFTRLGKTVQHWTQYEIRDNFLEPSKDWMLELGDSSVTDQLIKDLYPGDEVVFRVNGATQLTGFIDRMDVNSGRGGTTLSLQGRDVLAQVIDSCADPTVQLKDGATIADALQVILQEFDFFDYDIDNSANVDIIRGARIGTKRSKRGKQLKSYIMKRSKPYHGEGAYQFLDRLLKRQGLFMWADAMGQKLIVGYPDIQQTASHFIRNTTDGRGNNVLNSSCARDWRRQPSVLLVGGNSYGGQYMSSQLKIAIVNPAAGFGTDSYVTDKVAAILTKNKDAVPLVVAVSDGEAATFKPSKVARPLYLYDSESQKLDQLEFYARRQMSELMRQHFVYHCTVAGHVGPALNSEGSGAANGKAVWATDTIVDVHDERCGVKEPLYVLEKSFRKTRSAGTLTQLTMVRPSSMQWNQESAEAVAATKSQTAVSKNSAGDITVGNVTIIVDPKSKAIKDIAIKQASAMLTQDAINQKTVDAINRKLRDA